MKKMKNVQSAYTTGVFPLRSTEMYMPARKSQLIASETYIPNFYPSEFLTVARNLQALSCTQRFLHIVTWSKCARCNFPLS